MSELKPCPFCGMNGEAKYTVDYGGRTIFQCQWCGASHHSFDDWNNRPLEDALIARIAELEADIADLKAVQDAGKKIDEIDQLGKPDWVGKEQK